MFSVVTVLYMTKIRENIRVDGKLKQLFIGQFADVEAPQSFNKKEVRDFLFGFDWDKPWKREYLDKQLDRYLVTLDVLPVSQGDQSA